MRSTSPSDCSEPEAQHRRAVPADRVAAPVHQWRPALALRALARRGQHLLVGGFAGGGHSGQDGRVPFAAAALLSVASRRHPHQRLGVGAPRPVLAAEPPVRGLRDVRGQTAEPGCADGSVARVHPARVRIDVRARDPAVRALGAHVIRGDSQFRQCAGQSTKHARLSRLRLLGHGDASSFCSFATRARTASALRSITTNGSPWSSSAWRSSICRI
jgi:hypothetical protein